jgi:hypothetical protein
MKIADEKQPSYNSSAHIEMLLYSDSLFQKKSEERSPAHYASQDYSVYYSSAQLKEKLLLFSSCRF